MAMFFVLCLPLARGNIVVYNADQDTDGVREMYSVPIMGGTSVKLNATLPALGSISEFALNRTG